MKRSFSLQLAGLLAGLYMMAGASYGTTASTEPFDKAVATYLHGDYKQALPLFLALSKSDSSNVDVHYYLALSYRSLDQKAKAADEHQWDPRLFNISSNWELISS
jgi:hypothetical protein